MTKHSYRSPSAEAYELLMKQEEDFAMAMPHLFNFLTKKVEDVRGITLTLSRAGDWLAIAKRYGHEGKEQVMFSAGSEPFEALTQLNIGLKKGFWKDDNYHK